MRTCSFPHLQLMTESAELFGGQCLSSARVINRSFGDYLETSLLFYQFNTSGLSLQQNVII